MEIVGDCAQEPGPEIVVSLNVEDVRVALRDHIEEAGLIPSDGRFTVEVADNGSAWCQWEPEGYVRDQPRRRKLQPEDTEPIHPLAPGTILALHHAAGGGP